MKLRIPIGLFSYRIARLYFQGKNVKIGRRVRIIGDSIDLADNVKIDPYCLIQGRTIELAQGVHLQHHVEIGGMQTGQSKCIIGANSVIFTETILNDTYPIKIGKNVAIGGRSMIWTHGGWEQGGHEMEYHPVTIEDNAWLAWHVTVCPGVTIGEGSAIGTGAVVTKDIPPYSIAVGVPAKVIKSRKVEEIEEPPMPTFDPFGR